ncbi:uncharacterized protein MELLADRAFT_104869 [Melampsora larici-populina 98AG31]|uniref:Uncharacterized protein n=1 Tax=Melampsora larici-populina (strain 98AG31 / pathotype 3-4-7) TaxID=747676 RepID=F4RG11_MELLP|nr:uncharacterized protein MELLADRAFT_104869 [Melampsora larici-populina 98AG31]EGG08670.1 hypothetical protein MELLADRAFT_104869 [Melampsora larici-populina 98AG31]
MSAICPFQRKGIKSTASCSMLPTQLPTELWIAEGWEMVPLRCLLLPSASIVAGVSFSSDSDGDGKGSSSVIEDDDRVSENSNAQAHHQQTRPNSTRIVSDSCLTGMGHDNGSNQHRSGGFRNSGFEAVNAAFNMKSLEKHMLEGVLMVLY